ncbi:MAG: ornithine cyclodeaminase family protein [Planctomycetes bacterium]|nr:ornithine cyclodeaminase family protein [Planctomycetota bacterium]
MTLLLTGSDVKNVLDMKSTMDIVEKAFAELHNGTAVMPPRTPVPVPEHEGVSLFMPAFIKDMRAFGAKIVSVFKNNPKKYDLPTVLGVIVLLDDRTGEPLAIVDGGHLTAMRTGSVSGIATKHMAKPDAHVGAIIGTGMQARTQVWAMCEAKPFDRILAYSVDPPEQVEAFCREMSEQHGTAFERAATAEAAVREADVITLATSAAEPIIDFDWLHPGCHINGVGSHAPHMRELDERTVCTARIIADQKEACLAESGDFIIPMKAGKWDASMIAGDLGDVVTGEVAGRTDAEEVTLFKSNGLAIQDLSTAYAVYLRAKERGVGMEIDLAS